jgi:hypothetical protein
MKWVLVVLIGGVAPVTTDVTFEKLSDCLAAEQQLRQTYADAFFGGRPRFPIILWEYYGNSGAARLAATRAGVFKRAVR